MNLERELGKRSNHQCELCAGKEKLSVLEVQPPKYGGLEGNLLVCEVCKDQIENPDSTDPNHWRCLNDSMWSEHTPVKVMAWRMLSRLRKEGWPQDLLDMLYLDDDILDWAKATAEGAPQENQIIHRDSNGAVIEAGDSVVLIKDLAVKGSSMVAKRGTAVRRVSLDHENAEYIEGKVDGQQIVILTKFVKKI
ncbi:MAG: PhnA domain-containing protein [Flavobacteriaceae bacterium]